ncbi:MAG: discoidin domain-containing protein [Sphingopyxis sp.]|nr:discoidin domain-containing protein [Sphingopyxis sp.]
MQTNRRQFIARSAIGGFGLVAAPLLPAESARAGASPLPAAERQIIASIARYYRLSPEDGVQGEDFSWVQIDLGATRPIDAIRLRPPETSCSTGYWSSIHFCIDCSDDQGFGEIRPITNWRAEHSAAPVNFLAYFPQNAVHARYVRLSASASPPYNGAILPSGFGTIEILSKGAAISAAMRRWETNHRRG